jgi:hypothetical protein
MKGISFKPWKIKAIAESDLDKEWQTRRVIKPQPPEGASVWRIEEPAIGKVYFGVRRCNPWYEVKPQYQVGDVYIKEVWATGKIFDALTPKQIEETKAGTVPIWYRHDDTQIDRPGQIRGRWRSSMMMPEWAARYFIKITDVRAERLQEITNEDIIAEGLKRAEYKCNPGFSDAVMWAYHDGGTYCGESGIPVFQRLWDSINTDYPWQSNPWVWVDGFKRLNHS